MSEINSYEDYKKEFDKSVSNPEEFWAEKAVNLNWKKKWDKILEWNFEKPDVNWFIGGKLNITENCLDRHLEKNGDKTAFIWEPNDPAKEAVKISYKELHSKVCKFANVLKNNGIKKGDRVCIYLPMIPELVISVLGCARIGAVHSVVFAGFSADALEARINNVETRLLITSDGAFRGSKKIPIKETADEALKNCPLIEKIIVVKYTGEKIQFDSGKNIWWNEEMDKVTDECEAEEMDSNDPFFILYTSGSTGKPKGIVHTCGGYQVFIDYTFRTVFRCDANDIYWCTADIGWITGHSYLVYGPLMSGITSVMFEGIPLYPDPGRWWRIVEKYSVNVFYTSPTAIRSLQIYGTKPVEKYNLNSLKLLGSVGEPINESAWNWYHKNIGKEKCPIVDTWWQTETGGIMLSPLVNVLEHKPGYAMYPLPGVQLALVNEQGEELNGNDVDGLLCIKFPWPGILKTIYGDHERCRKTYFSRFPGLYFSEDGCKRDKDGLYRITGRVDDVIKVSGHLLGTAEIEDAINRHSHVVESAIVGHPHPIKGNEIQAFVVTSLSDIDNDKLEKEIKEHVNKTVGPIARPEKIWFVKALPKTRSGKIMRRILRKIILGERKDFGDTSTLIEPSVIDEIVSIVHPVSI